MLGAGDVLGANDGSLASFGSSAVIGRPVQSAGNGLVTMSPALLQ